MRHFIMFIILLTTCTSVHAAREGNGGDGLKVDGTLYLLDLVEAGVETKPFVNKDVKVPQFINDELQKKFKYVGDKVPLGLLASKLSELNLIYPALARSVLASMTQYDWSWVNHKLVDVKDEDSSLDYKEEDLQQIAIRRDRTIKISNKSWAELAAGLRQPVIDAHRVAVILHEVVYAMSAKNLVSQYSHTPAGHFTKTVQEYAQSSKEVRDFVGYLFKPEIQGGDTKALRSLAEVVFDNKGLHLSGPSRLVVERGRDLFNEAEGVHYNPEVRISTFKYYTYGSPNDPSSDTKKEDWHIQLTDFQNQESTQNAVDKICHNSVSYPKLNSEWKGFTIEDPIVVISHMTQFKGGFETFYGRYDRSLSLKDFIDAGNILPLRTKAEVNGGLRTYDNVLIDGDKHSTPKDCQEKVSELLNKTVRPLFDNYEIVN